VIRQFWWRRRAAFGRGRWQPRHTALDDIVRTAFAWREAHPNGYGD